MSRSVLARPPRSVAFTALLLTVLGFASSGELEAQTATLTVGSATAQPGDTVPISITLNSSDPSDGVSFGVAQDANLTLVGTPVLGAALDASQGGFDPAFAFINAAFDPVTSESGFTAGIVFDVLVMVSLPANVDHSIVDATYTVSTNAAAGASLPLAISGGLGPVGGGALVAPLVVMGSFEARLGLGLTAFAGGVTIPATSFIRGDTDENGTISLLDAINTLRHMVGQPAPSNCIEVYDVNGNGVEDTTLDAMMLLQYLYASGPPPSAPFPVCGTLATYPLGCDSHAACP